MAQRLKVIVDRDKCVGSGECVFSAPEVFAQGEEDGLAFPLTAEPDAALWNTAREAARNCPAGAIRIEEA